MDIDKSKIDRFAQMAQAMDKRIANLYQNVSTTPIIPNALPQALMELGSASQKINHALEELYQQNEQLAQTRDTLEQERLHYQELFEEAPDGYLITDAEGKILQINRTAARLLNNEKQFLVGKLMINLVLLEERQCFRNFLSQLKQYNRNQELVIRLQQRSGEFFDAALTVAVSRNNQGEPQSLRWQVRDITERKRAEFSFVNKDCCLECDRPAYKYSKEEIIPLNPLSIWYVRQGLVKLTTFCENSEEVLVGLAVPGMIFGSNMTSLHTYQATALSNVELVSIHLSELTASPILSNALLPKINQRLQQTESFLVIFGFRRVQERLYHLLQLLKQEIGEPVPEGTRLSARLTHEDFAKACCTTRVTITRLMCKLKKQGKICLDAKNHIIIKNI